MASLRTASGVVTTAIAVVLGLVCIVFPCSLVACGYAFALLLIGVGLLKRRVQRIAVIGAVSFVALLGWRAARGPRVGVEVAVWPQGGSRTVNRLYEERDGTLPMARMLRWMGTIPRDESYDFVVRLARVYDAMDAEIGVVPTPAVATYLGLERPTAFDTVVFRPATVPRFAVVFLHGYAGNYVVYCWVMSRAVTPLGGMTVCPSVGSDGSWWLPDGARTLETSIEVVRRQGVERIVLAGLSNGGLGASRLAPQLRASLAGLVLVSGCDPDAPSAGIPTLVVQGRSDSMMPARNGRACARQTGAQYVEIDSGHFMLIDHDEELVRAVRAWLKARFGA
jgi:predicted esterase